MTTAEHQIPNPFTAPPPGTFVGTGRVLSCDDEGLPTVRLMDRFGSKVSPSWALPFRYLPEEGDLLLILGRGGRYWVTGVAHGRGRSQLAFQGNAALRSSKSLRLKGDNGVRVRGQKVSVNADELETHVTTIVQRLDEQQIVVSGLIDERAGQCSRAIEGEDRQIAGTHSTMANHAVKRDGALLILS